MSIRFIAVMTMLAAALALEACTYTHATYDNAPVYPSHGPVGSGPYAYGPHDPYGGYFQNYYPVPSYYEPFSEEAACDDPRCAAIPTPHPVQTEARSDTAVPEQNLSAPHTANSGPASIERSRARRTNHHRQSSSD